MVLDRPKHIITYEEALNTLIHNDIYTNLFSRVRRRHHMLTCDQTITPAKNARVCIISFSALRPARTANSPDFCINKENSNKDKLQGRCEIIQHPITHLPKPRQYSEEQNCRVHQYSH
jgi:hypothetical protein